MNRLQLDQLWRRCELGEATAVLETLGAPPPSPAAQLLRAIAHEQTGDLESAQRDLDEIVALQPENLVAQLHRGLVAFRRGDYAAAARDLPAEGPLFPDRDWIKRALRLFWPLRREHPEILTQGMTPLAGPHPLASDVARGDRAAVKKLERRGVQMYFRGELRDALFCFENAARLNPEERDAGANAAWVALRLGEVDTAGRLLEPLVGKALEDYLREKKTELLPHSTLIVLYAWLLHEKDQHRAALALLSHVRPEGPDDYYAHAIAGLCWTALGETAHADAAWDVAFSDFFLDSWQQLAEPYLRKVFSWLAKPAVPS